MCRAAPYQALGQFEEILSHGITVVTLQDQKEWTHKDIKGGDVLPLLSSILVMARAHEESATKAKRMKAAWKNKREKAAKDGHKLTARCPAWLTLDKEAGEFQVIKERAAVVQRIFSLTLDGIGKGKIAEQFNVNGVPTFGKSAGWQPSYVQKILDNEAVIGAYQPMRREYKDDGRRVRIPDGEFIEGYFPAVVDKAVFYRARELRAARQIGGGRTGTHVSNLFTGIAKCGVCGGSMVYDNKGRGHTYLVCSNAKRKASNCQRHTWKYQPTEAIILLCLRGIDFRELFPETYGKSREIVDRLEGDRLIKAGALDKTKSDEQGVVDLLIDRPGSKALQSRLDVLEDRTGHLTKELEQIDQEIASERVRLKTVEETLTETQDALSKWAEMQREGEDRYAWRAKLHQLLKRAVPFITLEPLEGKHGMITIKVEGAEEAITVKVEEGLDRAVSSNGATVEVFEGSIPPIQAD